MVLRCWGCRSGGSAVSSDGSVKVPFQKFLMSLHDEMYSLCVESLWGIFLCRDDSM